MTWHEQSFHLGSFLTILDSGLQDLTRTSPHMHVMKLRMCHRGCEHQVNGGPHAGGWMWTVIVVINDSHWPQTCIHHVWPMKSGMDQKHVGLGEKSLYCMFSNAILVMRTVPLHFMFWRHSSISVIN